jgi:endonuclease YncB( thermonuclease family)
LNYIHRIGFSCCLFGIFFLTVIGQTHLSINASTSSRLESNTENLDLNYNRPMYGIQIAVSNDVNQNKSSDIELEGIVTKVVDGDTLDINGTRIRLALVDTPERGQPGFDQAKEFVESICLGKKGELDVDSGQRRGDRYGREVGVVYCDGVNANEKLMTSKLARILVEFCDISEFSNDNWTITHCQDNLRSSNPR